MLAGAKLIHNDSHLLVYIDEKAINFDHLDYILRTASAVHFEWIRNHKTLITIFDYIQSKGYSTKV